MKDILEEVLRDKPRLYAMGTAICFGLAFESFSAGLFIFFVMGFILTAMRED